MLVLGVNRVTDWCRVFTGRGTYTCPTKNIDGQLFFRFKKVWHPVAKYISDHAAELVEEGGRLFSRPFRP